jgi:hypothetical protein
MSPATAPWVANVAWLARANSIVKQTDLRLRARPPVPNEVRPRIGTALNFRQVTLSCRLLFGAAVSLKNNQ